MPEHLLVVVWAIAALIQGHRLQSMFERMPEHRHDFDHTAHRVGLNIWPMVCRESGLALLVLACTGLLAECRHEDMLQ